MHSTANNPHDNVNVPRFECLLYAQIHSHASINHTHSRVSSMAAHQPLVVVIGAGLAGLATAVTLTSNSTTFKVRLLEAASQPGGRIKSHRLSDGVSVPLGAMYFHGEKGNSLLEFAIQHDIVRRENGRDGKANWRNLLTDGTRLPQHEVDQYEGVFREILNGAAEPIESCECSHESVSDIHVSSYEGCSSIAMKDYITAQFNDRICSLPPTTDCSPLALLECFLYIEGILEGSKSMEDVDRKRYDDFKWLEGVRYLLFEGNPMQKIVDTLVKQLPEGVLQLNCEVESIVWNQEQCPHPITVCCTNGDQYSADHVITTVSLGVLKNKLNSPFFIPPLPEDKQKAIASLGYGTVNKLFLQFPVSLFSEDYYSVRVFHKDGKLAEKFPWTRCLHRFHTVPGTSVLLFWFAGDDAATIEHIPSAELAKGICYLLESLLHKPIPAPIMVASSQWHGDPLFCGSYSYSAAGCAKKHRSDLSTPVDGSTPLQLLFAGGATHTSLFSTANAAYDTGTAAARTLVDKYSN